MTFSDMNKEFYQKEITCLTRIVFNEARNEPIVGQQLVAQVVVNRLNNSDFPKSVCGNLKMRNAFSFLNPRTQDKKRTYPKYFTEIADKALKGEYTKLIDSRVLYFKRCEHPSSFFENKLKMVKRVNKHCFYRQHSLR